jgi:hypothetical protein
MLLLLALVMIVPSFEQVSFVSKQGYVVRLVYEADRDILSRHDSREVSVELEYCGNDEFLCFEGEDGFGLSFPGNAFHKNFGDLIDLSWSFGDNDYIISSVGLEGGMVEYFIVDQYGRDYNLSQVYTRSCGLVAFSWVDTGPGIFRNNLEGEQVQSQDIERDTDYLFVSTRCDPFDIFK